MSAEREVELANKRASVELAKQRALALEHKAQRLCDFMQLPYSLHLQCRSQWRPLKYGGEARVDVNATTSHDDANEDEYSDDTQSTQVMKDHLEVAKAAADVLRVSLGAIEAAKTLIEAEHHHVLAGNNKFIIFIHVLTVCKAVKQSSEALAGGKGSFHGPSSVPE